jgi:hypothetical protein
VGDLLSARERTLNAPAGGAPGIADLVGGVNQNINARNAAAGPAIGSGPGSYANSTARNPQPYFAGQPDNSIQLGPAQIDALRTAALNGTRPVGIDPQMYPGMNFTGPGGVPTIDDIMRLQQTRFYRGQG